MKTLKLVQPLKVPGKFYDSEWTDLYILINSFTILQEKGRCTKKTELLIISDKIAYPSIISGKVRASKFFFQSLIYNESLTQSDVNIHSLASSQCIDDCEEIRLDFKWTNIKDAEEIIYIGFEKNALIYAPSEWVRKVYEHGIKIKKSLEQRIGIEL